MKLLDLFCGAGGASMVGPSVDRVGARAIARRRGWTHIKGRDFCPDCTRERSTPEAAA